MREKLIVVSVDAMIYEDLALAETLPTFRFLMENGSRVNRLRSVYPTLTYPCHTTMLTGCWPDRHGVCNNEKQQIGVSSPDWNFDHSAVRCPDLLDVCRRAGLTTAAVSWPVTGNHPSADYLVDEIWPNPIPDAQDEALAGFRQEILGSGTPEELFRDLVEPVLLMRIRRSQPGTAWFSTKIAAELLRRFRPDLLMLHIAAVDTFRHKAGVFSALAEEGIRQTDAMLRTLLDAVRETGDFERTNFVITSDHGQIDVDRAVRVNVLLREHGYIRTDASGQVTDWDAWCFSAGTSAQLRLRDESLRGEIEALLRERLAQGDAGYGAVYTAEELAVREHICGSFSFMLETDGHTKFSSGWDGSYLKALPAAVGSHGYHPDHGPSPTFLGFGPAFRKGVVLEQAMLTDGAPTYARILGTELPDADGRVLTELLVPRLSDPV